MEKTYGDDLLRDEPGDSEEITALARNTEQESNGEEEVAKDGLERELGVVDVEVTSPPGEQTVDETNKGDDTEEGGDDAASNLETKPCTVGESVESVLSLVLVIVRDDNTTSSQRLVGLGVSKLGHGQRGGDGHDARGDKHLSVKTETDVANQDGTRDGCETASHDLVNLGLGHVWHERTDQHGGLTLSNEGSGSSDDGLSARDTQSPEDKCGELDDEPLKEANVVQDLDEGDEEDDGGNDTEEEARSAGNVGVGQEDDTIASESKEITGAVSDELEDVVSDTGTQDEEANDVLGKHAANDRAPVDTRTRSAGGPEAEADEEDTEETDGTVLTGVVRSLLRDEGTDEHRTNSDRSTSRSAQLRRDHVVDGHTAARPNPLDGVGDVTAGNVEEDQAQHDGEPQQEGNDPVLGVAVQDQRRDPPASEETEDEEVKQRTTVAVDRSPAAASESRVGHGLSISSRDTVVALLVIAILGEIPHIGLLGRDSIVGAACIRVRVSVALGDLAVVVQVDMGGVVSVVNGGARGVDDIVRRLSRSRMVLVRVRVLVRGIKSWIKRRVGVATQAITSNLLGGVVVRRRLGVGGSCSVGHCDGVCKTSRSLRVYSLLEREESRLRQK